MIKNIIDVHEQIINIINDDKLKNKLNAYIESTRNQAPKLLTGEQCWQHYINILNIHIPNKTRVWHHQITNILNLSNQ